MSRIAIEGSAYAGRTSSPPWRLPHDPLNCRSCGSSLVGRRIDVRRQITHGVSVVTEVFQCRCLRRRRVPREVAAG